MFLQVPEEIRRLGPPSVSPAALPPVTPRPTMRPTMRTEDIEAHPVRPQNFAREMRQVPMMQPPAAPAGHFDYRAMRPLQPVAPQPAPHAQPAPLAAKPPPVWWEDPIALGSLLILLPPVGLAAVWMSKRYSNDARWALTVMTALTMSLMTAIVIAGLVMR